MTSLLPDTMVLLLWVTLLVTSLVSAEWVDPIEVQTVPSDLETDHEPVLGDPDPHGTFDWGQPIHDPFDFGGGGWGQPVEFGPTHAPGNGDWGGDPIDFDTGSTPTPTRYHSDWASSTTTSPEAQREANPDLCWAQTSECGLCQCCFMTTVVRAKCQGPNITEVPQDLPANITHLRLEGTSIEVLRVIKQVGYPRSKFEDYPRLQELNLLNNKRLKKIELGAFFFVDYTDLKSLFIDGSPLLTSMSTGVLGQFYRLTTLKVVHTGLQTPPSWDIFHHGSEFMSLIDLSFNDIEVLDSNAFQPGIETGTLMITNNERLRTIGNYAFNGSNIGHLDLSDNKNLVTLENRAFANIKSFYTLDLSGTAIEHLPSAGLQSIMRLRILSTPSLQTFISVLHLHAIKEAELTYQHHCCAFAHPDKQDHDLYVAFIENREEFMREMEMNCAQTPTDVPMTTALVTGIREREDTLPDPGQVGERPTTVPRYRSFQSGAGPRRRRGVPGDGIWHKTTINPNVNHTNKISCGTLLDNIKNTSCVPNPDAFNPCEDVLGSIWLRVICWLIVITAVLGNFVVIVVTLGNHSKMTVSKLLISNLAFSDLVLGLYLAVLAAFDLYSKSVYFTIAIPWQNNGGCQVAGFLATFATCLSVFTLTVITVERWYVLSDVYNRRMRLKVASVVMTCGWIYSLVMAILPITGVSSFSKTSICLPMETSDPEDLSYVIILMLINTGCFVVICSCYIDIYRSVRSNNTPAGQSDITVAKRMALLIITDFMCLFPIVFFGLTAALGLPLISVPNSKILLVICFPLNSCANPFLYAIKTKQFRRDLLEMLSRCGYCEQRALKYRLGMTTNPMSYSQSRGSLSGTTQNLIHRPSLASTTLTCLSNNSKTAKAATAYDTYREYYLNKQNTQESEVGSPPLSPVENVYCPLPTHDPVMLTPEKDSDPRKLSVVLEDDQGLHAEGTHATSSCSLERSDSSPCGSSRDDLDKRPCPRVRSVSEYSDGLLLKVSKQLEAAADKGWRKGSETTCLTTLSDFSENTNKSSSSAESEVRENSPASLKRIRHTRKRQPKKSFPGDSGIADINGYLNGENSADDPDAITDTSLDSGDVFQSLGRNKSLKDDQQQTKLTIPDEHVYSSGNERELPKSKLCHAASLDPGLCGRHSLQTPDIVVREVSKKQRLSDGYLNQSYHHNDIPQCVQ